MDLRPDSLMGLAERHADNEGVATAVFVLGRLCYLALDQDRDQVLDIDAELEKAAPDLIASYVEILHQARLGEAAQSRGTQPALQPKLGRNDPCPCGSGKKFKRCCMNKPPPPSDGPTVMEARGAPNPATDVLHEFRRAMGDHVFESEEALQSSLDQFVEQKNTAPMLDFWGSRRSISIRSVVTSWVDFRSTSSYG